MSYQTLFVLIVCDHNDLLEGVDLYHPFNFPSLSIEFLICTKWF